MFDVELLRIKDGNEPEDKVEIEILQQPPKDCERTAKDNDQVSVHYIGYHKNGQEFDSSRKRKEPLVIILGRGQVIPGWEQGIRGMCIGERRKLTIPPQLGKSWTIDLYSSLIGL